VANGYNTMDVITSAVAQLSREAAIKIMLEAEHRGLFPDRAAFATVCSWSCGTK
jgi:hypothetical protein